MAQLLLTRELADARRSEQEALARAQGAELARQALCAERDDERERREKVASLVVEIGDKDDAARALRKVIDEQGQIVGGACCADSLVEYG